jgi:hypothetical protein
MVGKPTLRGVRLLDPETANAWDDLTDPEGSSAPKDVGEMLVEIIFDPLDFGYRGGTFNALDADGRAYPVEAGDRRYRTLPHTAS